MTDVRVAAEAVKVFQQPDARVQVPALAVKMLQSLQVPSDIYLGSINTKTLHQAVPIHYVEAVYVQVLQAMYPTPVEEEPAYRLVWDKVGERYFETGVDRGVLYPVGSPGVVWNGLVSVSESSGAENSEYHYDGVKYLDVVGTEDFEATIEAYSAPREFDVCDGSLQLAPGLFATQQPRQPFGFSYRTLLGNDVKETKYGYKLHLVYNATAVPASKTSSTLTDRPDPRPRQWTFYTVPQETSTYRPTAHFEIDSTLVDPAALAALEDILYGTEEAAPRLPDQSEVVSLLAVPDV